MPTGTVCESTGSEPAKPLRYTSAISFFVSADMIESTEARL